MKTYLGQLKPMAEPVAIHASVSSTSMLRTTPIPDDQIDDDIRNDDIIINTTDSIDYLDDNSASMDKEMIFLLPKGDAIAIDGSKEPKGNDEATSTIYECSSCSAGFFSYASLSQHIINEHKAFHCKHCKLYFDAEAYELHKRIHEPDDDASSDGGKFNCDVCVLRFDRKDAFDEHCTKFHTIEGEPFDDELEFQENLKYEVIEEAEVQDEEENNAPADEQAHPAAAIPPDEEKFYCSNCNAVFAKQLSLNIHFNSKRCMQESFQCDICHKVFIKKSNLSSHMKMHGTKLELSCTTCKVEFRDRDQYLVHMKNRHPSTKRYICTSCPKCKFQINNLIEGLEANVNFLNSF